MDNILEWVVPLIFAAIYFFGNMFSKKTDDESAPDSRRQAEDPEATERQRNIQEEIRRKIMERRNQGEGTPSPSTPHSPEPVEGGSPDEMPAGHSRPAQHASRRNGEEPDQPAESNASKALRERRAAVEQRRQQRNEERQSTRDRHATDRQLQGHPDSTQTPRPVSQSQPEPGFSWDANDNIYDAQIEDRLKKIELTKRQAAKLTQQASKTGRSSTPEARPRSRNRLARGPIRSTLKDPAAARTAFIYGEVLGPPISQRKTPTVPGLVR